MNSDELRNSLADLFRETAQAHHAAYRATDGVHDEWPLWYAEQMQDRIGELLGTRLTVSELVWALVEAQKELEDEGEEDWVAFYADFFQDTYGSDETL